MRDEVTLHVGAGTFKPVKSEEIEDHHMHTEYIVVHRHTFERLLQHHGEAVAVGTTSVRTLESLYYMGVKLAMNPSLTDDDLRRAAIAAYEELRAEQKMRLHGIPPQEDTAGE